MSRRAMTTITILHHDRPEDLKACLESIFRNTEGPFEIILVDNGSSDPAAKAFVRSLKEVILVDIEENISPESASAKAIAIARGDFIVGMTDDVITTPGWLKRFIEHVQRCPSTGLLGPRSNFVSGPQLVRRCQYRDFTELDAFALNWACANPMRLTPYSRLVGFCWFCSRAVTDTIGFMDPSFGFGFSDDDFCLRANLAGFKTAIAQDVFIHHTGGPQGKGEAAHQKMLMEAWTKFKKKWGLPPDMPLSEYQPKALLNRPFDPKRDYIPLPSPEEVEPFIYRRAKPYYFMPHDPTAPAASTLSSPGLAKAMAPGLASFYMGRLEEAIALLKEIVCQHEKSFEPHMALGCCLAKAGRMEEAIVSLSRAMELQPNSCRPGNALGSALLSLGRNEKAEEALKAADMVSLYSHQAKFNLIRYYVGDGKPDRAVEIATQAFHRQPNDSTVMTTLAHLLINSRRYDEALEYLKRYLSIAGQDPRGYLLLFRTYWEKGEKPNALETLRVMRSAAKSDKVLSERLAPFFKPSPGNNENAINQILQVATSLFDNLRWEDDFSVDFLVKDEVFEALRQYAQKLYEQDRTEDALALYKILNKLDPEHATVLNDLATILWAQGDIDGALAHISLALQLDPFDKDIVWNGGLILNAIGQSEKATGLYEQYLRANPHDKEIAAELHRIQSTRGHIMAAQGSIA